MTIEHNLIERKIIYRFVVTVTNHYRLSADFND